MLIFVIIILTNFQIYIIDKLCNVAIYNSVYFCSKANLLPNNDGYNKSLAKIMSAHGQVGSTFESYGAKGDGVTDDTESITKAFNSPAKLIYAGRKGAKYRVSNMIVVNDIDGKKIITLGITILNSDLTKATFLFQKCSNIKIQGGTFGYEKLPAENGNNSQHVIQFESCVKITVDGIHIINSPEMGIAITNSNFITVQHSFIENTYRDGTYAHYSSNVKYLYNRYKNIKDDAMSFHDYGIESQKSQLIKYGYKKASNIFAIGNIVENSYQGFASIGSSNVNVSKNKFYNTVLSGIAVFNSEALYPNGDASVENAIIIGNTLNNVCAYSVNIIGKNYSNNGQASTGRAAIFIGSLGPNSQLFTGEQKCSKNVRIENNIINKCGADGFWSNRADKLYLKNNKFTNCSGKMPEHSLAGNVVEIYGVSNFEAYNNSIIDNRAKKLHEYGFVLGDVSGKMRGWNVRGVRKSDKILTNTKSLKSL